MVGVVPILLGHDALEQVELDVERRLARREAGAVRTRKMWVSTAMVGSPKAMLSTTFAVLRPTPGRASAPRACAAPRRRCSATSFCDSSIRFFALVR